MEFMVDILDYGRHGVTVREPRTGLTGSGDTKVEALDDLKIQLGHEIEYGYVPPADGPVRSIESITV